MSLPIPVSQGRITATGYASQVERKLDIVLQGMRGNRPVRELCREAGIPDDLEFMIVGIARQKWALDTETVK